ncbi:MAG TPA: DUF4386 domain-containing protein [Pyrinomonadaceae bacterium]|nr:DUF4386 domain-containing protein [Pyrinomonadaceae bacterium]
MNSDKQTARLAGFIYLIVVVTGIFSLAYVPAKLIVWGDANKTFQNIAESQFLFRLGIVSSVICYLAFLILPLVLYRLLRRFSESTAKLMVVLAVVSVPISFLNLSNKYAVLTLIKGADYLKNLRETQPATQAMQYLENYDNGILIVTVFWGLWLFPFGYLVYKSGFLPKILGIILMLGCIGYLVSFVGNTLSDDYGGTTVASVAKVPRTLGEIGICLWLLIVGVRGKSALEKQNT